MATEEGTRGTQLDEEMMKSEKEKKIYKKKHGATFFLGSGEGGRRLVELLREPAGGFESELGLGEFLAQLADLGVLLGLLEPGAAQLVGQVLLRQRYVALLLACELLQHVLQLRQRLLLTVDRLLQPLAVGRGVAQLLLQRRQFVVHAPLPKPKESGKFTFKWVAKKKRAANESSAPRAVTVSLWTQIILKKMEPRY